MADRIEQQIQNAEKAIDKLNNKIRSLKNELESGDWGTGQVKQMQTQLEKLTSTLERRTSRRETLISQRDAQEVERLNRTIDTLKAKLLSLNDLKAGFKTQGLTGTDDFKKVERDIVNAEKALRSFKSRLAGRQLQPSGAHIFTPEETRAGIRSSSTLPIETPNKEDIERRLNKAILGMPLTNSEVQDKVRRARELALDVMYGRVGQVGEARRVGREIPETGEPAAFDFSKLSPEAQAAAKALEQQAKATKGAARATDELSEADKRREERAKRARLEEERLAAARSKVANDPRYRQALEQAQARGFTINQLRGIEDRGGNVQRLRFAQTQGGVNQQFNPYVNLQTGRSTPGLSSQFRTFGSDILRDIGQFTKWSIAIAAVYTPMQKLGELISIMIDNESRLADAVIVANVAFEDSGRVFDEVALAADAAGEGINTTIDAYTSAVRAAGRYTDEATKQIATQRLLADSLILSKLSTLDQTTAIDTLSAALLQSGRGLDEGQELLNKWVRVAQIANVDIATLATGVAVLGDAAETSGLSIDELNGLIAVLAEQSISGSKEAANTAKALVGAYQSDKAEAALNRYGIALRNTNGEVREFLDVYKDLARLREEGVLSDAAVSELALALGGGGVRRAKDASALINAQGRLNDIAKESQLITEDSTLANDALEKKLQTVQTAATRLANAFQSLAQTLGDEGGVLDTFKLILDVLTGVTKAADELFSILGRSGPILATFTTGLLALRAIHPASRETLLAGLGTTRQFSGFLGGQAQYGGGYVNRGGLGRGALADILQMNYRGAGILGGAGVAIAGAQNLAGGRNEQALGNVLGGVIGAAIGASLGGPIGLAAGATIGSSAGEAMVDLVTGYIPQWQNLFAPPEREPGEPGGTVEDERTALLERLSRESGRPEIVARAVAFALRSLPQFLTKNFPGSEEYRRQLSAEQIQLAYAPEELQSEIRRQEELRRRQAGEFDISGGGAGVAQLRAQLEAQATAERQRQLGRLAQGEIRPAEFGRISQQLAGFPSTAIQAIGAYGDEFIKIDKNIDDVSDAYEALLFITSNGTEEQIAQLSRYSTDIRTLQYLIETFQPKDIGMKLQLTFGEVVVESPEQLKKILAGLQTEGATTAIATGAAIRAQQGQEFRLPQLVGDYNEPLTGREQDIVVEKGLAIQEQYLQEIGATAEEMQKFKEGLEAFYTSVDRGTGVIFESVSGLSQQFYDLGKSAAEAAGEIEKVKGFGFQQFDVDRATLENLAAKSISIGRTWADQFPGFETKPEDLLAITNEGLAKPIHADFRILALLLEQLNDKAQKQLDGQYNIPEGATFWVPLTAAYYRNKGGDTGLQSMLDSLAVDQNTSATDQNTQALRDAAQAFRGDRGFAPRTPEYLARIPRTPGFPGDRGESREAERLRQQAIGFRGDLGYSRRQVTPETATGRPFQFAGGGVIAKDYGPQIQQLLSELKNFFNGLLQKGGGTSFKDAGTRTPGIGGTGGGSASRVGAGATTVNTSPTTKLDLRVSSNINLLVDGRVLASTLQSYLASELIRTEQTQGTITRRFVA